MHSPVPDAHAFTLVVRWLHVASMAVALGGAVLLVALPAGREPSEERHRALVAVAARYEWAFWAAIGLLAMTGVGNLAAFGIDLPMATTRWGGVFAVKLVAVIALATFSVPRTLAIAQLRAKPEAVGARVVTMLRALYSVTSAGLAAVLALAVWLAHG